MKRTGGYLGQLVLMEAIAVTVFLAAACELSDQLSELCVLGAMLAGAIGGLMCINARESTMRSGRLVYTIGAGGMLVCAAIFIPMRFEVIYKASLGFWLVMLAGTMMALEGRRLPHIMQLCRENGYALFMAMGLVLLGSVLFLIAFVGLCLLDNYNAIYLGATAVALSGAGGFIAMMIDD